jgi:hypothetical protein
MSVRPKKAQRRQRRLGERRGAALRPERGDLRFDMGGDLVEEQAGGQRRDRRP